VFVFVAIFIQTVVGQMHIGFAKVRPFWLLIFACAESGQPFIANKCFERGRTYNHHVNSEIEFKAAEQEWLLQVFLDCQSLVNQIDWQLVDILEQLYAFAFSSCLRLRDKDSLLVAFLVGYELIHVAFWLEIEGFGDEIEAVGLDALSELDQVSKHVLMG